MAITRAQQAGQMLKTAGAVEQDGVMNYITNSKSVTVPREFKARANAPATKLAYITAAEAEMLKKKKPGTPHKGPKNIPSYDSFDAQGNFRSGQEMSAAERGDKGAFGRDPRAMREARDIRSSVIASGLGQRVNPGFFDSRDIISPEELKLARQYAKKSQFGKKAFARTRGGGILGFLRSGGILGNLVRSLGQSFGFGKKFNQPTYDMSKVSGLPLGGSAAFQNLDIRDKFDRTADDEDENIDEFGYSPNFLSNLVDEVALTREREQRQSDEEDQLGDIGNLMAFKPGSTKDRQLKQMYNIFQETGMEDPRMRNLMQEDIEGGAPLSLPSEAYQLAADGGLIGGGIMDAAGRQQYFLGKLVKKATRAVKKIVKSPVGKLGIGAALLGGFTPGGFKGLGKLIMDNKALAGAIGLIGAPFIFGDQDNQQQPSGFTGSVGGQIDSRAYTDPYSVLFGAFKAEGGSMKDEPVAKRTMPLLDMGGQEMDLRAEGGFVPIGRMEKADDVPARLSKNEFVFTADAVRNAGDGDVDKGAEVMYNMMKNLEAGGDVSEESQGKEGARRMFQTSQRLEEVL